MKRIFLAVILIFLIASCATHQGTINMSAIDKNIIYQRTAIGISQSHRVLGIGGLTRDALIYEAKKELYKNFPIQANEAYMNFILDIKKSHFILYSQTKITITADIVDLTGDSVTQPFSKNYINQLENSDLYKPKFFEIGDSIIFDIDKKGVIISFPRDKYVTIQYITQKGTLQMKNMSVYDIYTCKKNYGKYKIGDIFIYEIMINKELVSKAWEIVAIGENSLMIKSPEYRKLKIEKYK